MMSRSLLCLTVLGLSACSTLSPPAYDTVAQTENMEAAYKQSAFIEARNASYSDQPVETTQWWMKFNDPTLDRLISEGLSDNKDISAATARLNIARANLSLSRKERLPTDSQSLSSQRVGTADMAGFETPDRTLLNTSVSALWEWDVFGRIRRGIDVAQANLAQRTALLADVQSLIIADIAETYVQLRGLQEQANVIQENINTLQRTVDLTIIIRDAGRGTDLDVERANEQLASTQALLPPIYASIDRARYQLGILTGKTPPEIIETLSAPEPLKLMNGQIAAGSATDLIRRRPDIIAAEWALTEANAAIGLRKSEAFPVIGLAGSFGLGSERIENIFNGSSISYGIGPSLSFSATDFVRNEDRVEAAIAGAEAELAAYENSVLSALAEVETALSAQYQSQRQIQALTEAKRAAAEAARLARIRFENGASTFLTVLDAERRSISASTALSQARTQTALAQVSIFRALRAGPR